MAGFGRAAEASAATVGEESEATAATSRRRRCSHGNRTHEKIAAASSTAASRRPKPRHCCTSRTSRELFAGSCPELAVTSAAVARLLNPHCFEASRSGASSRLEAHEICAESYEANHVATMSAPSLSSVAASHICQENRIVERKSAMTSAMTRCLSAGPLARAQRPLAAQPCSGSAAAVQTAWSPALCR